MKTRKIIAGIVLSMISFHFCEAQDSAEAKKLDISISYIGLNFKVDAKKPKLEGKLIWGYNGPAVTATYSFGKKYWVHEN